MRIHISILSAGFSLVESIVAMAIFAVISTAALKVMVAGRRSNTQQMQGLQINNELRVGMALVERELRGLDTVDSVGSDIVDLSDDAIEYNAMRALAFVCKPVLPGAKRIVVWKEPSFGQRRMRPDSDSLLLYAGGRRWVRRDLLSMVATSECRDNQQGFTLTTDSALPALPTGTPIRAFEVNTIRQYRRDGFWLGMARRRKNGSWTNTQPFLGPLASDGFRVARVLSTGRVAALRVRLAVQGFAGAVDTLTSVIALRNSMVAW